MVKIIKMETVVFDRKTGNDLTFTKIIKLLHTPLKTYDVEYEVRIEGLEEGEDQTAGLDWFGTDDEDEALNKFEEWVNESKTVRNERIEERKKIEDPENDLARLMREHKLKNK